MAFPGKEQGLRIATGSSSSRQSLQGLILRSVRHCWRCRSHAESQWRDSHTQWSVLSGQKTGGSLEHYTLSRLRLFGGSAALSVRDLWPHLQGCQASALCVSSCYILVLLEWGGTQVSEPLALVPRTLQPCRVGDDVCNVPHGGCHHCLHVRVLQSCQLQPEPHQGQE